MELEFKEATCTWNRQSKTVLLNKEDNIKLHENVSCSSYCIITVNGVKREVVWKWKYVTSAGEDKNDERDEQRQVDDDEEEDDKCDDSLHTVPFKVIGAAYLKVAQRLLEKLYMKWVDMKDKVEAKEEPEPFNKYDSNTIVVSLKYEQKQKQKHQFLQNGNLTAVAIKHIKFRTAYMKVGFYVTLENRRKGQ